jgi:hypothetical protein
MAIIKYIFTFLITIHGLIHVMGFGKAFNYGNISQLTKDISKPMGIVWFITALLFVGAMVLFLLKNENWISITLIAALLSQILIFTVWQDAKFGTIANVIALVIAIGSWGNLNFEAQFKNDVLLHLQQTDTLKTELLTEADIQSLPPLIQKYIRYVGVLGKPKVKNFRLVFDGQMRDKGKDWFPFRSEQYNFFDDPTRLFFMKAQMSGVTISGYHAYKDATATMQIKLFGLYPIVDIKGKALNQAETVTLFNDMCIFAPAALIDNRIQWQEEDSQSVKAVFTNKGITISAVLYFNEQGQLINFVSDDRTSVNDMKQYRFSTPIKDYKNINGLNLPTYGEAIWHYPDGLFIYGKFYFKEIEYNTSEIPPYKLSK